MRRARISRSVPAVGRGALAARRSAARVAGRRCRPAGRARARRAGSPTPVRPAWCWSTAGIARLPLRVPERSRHRRVGALRRVRARRRCPALLEPRRFCVDRYEWPNLVGENPRVYVVWFQAKELCWNVGKRLCRRSEWMLACEGPSACRIPMASCASRALATSTAASVPFDFDAMLEPRDARERALASLASRSHRLAPRLREPVRRLRHDRQRRRMDRQPGRRSADQRVSTLNGGYWGRCATPAGSRHVRTARRSASTRSGFVAAPTRPMASRPHLS